MDILKIVVGFAILFLTFFGALGAIFFIIKKDNEAEDRVRNCPACRNEEYSKLEREYTFHYRMAITCYEVALDHPEVNSDEANKARVKCEQHKEKRDQLLNMIKKEFPDIDHTCALMKPS